MAEQPVSGGCVLIRTSLYETIAPMKDLSSTASINTNVLTKVDFADRMDVVYLQSDSARSFSFPLQKFSSRLLKRSIDVFVSTLLIVFVLSWLVPIIGILIKCSSRGPIFFLQTRHKKGGRHFTCLKFRTMIVNQQADTLPATAGDKRITSIGHFLRNHHLDEFPQLLNVWWGDMSLIGPRPHMLSESMKYEGLLGSYAARHCVKPGITGLAQVKGLVGVASPEGMKARVDQDIHYICYWTPSLDARIICQTIFRILR